MRKFKRCKLQQKADPTARLKNAMNKGYLKKQGLKQKSITPGAAASRTKTITFPKFVFESILCN
jgi:hypothetical protein